MVKNVSVIGSGAWGTALAIVAAHAGSRVTLWGRSSESVQEINSSHTHQTVFKHISLPKEIVATSSLATASNAQVLVLAVPAQKIREVALRLSSSLPKETVVVIAAKGIEEGTGYLMSEVLKETLSHNPIAALSGPNFAIEVAQGLPAASTVACEDRKVWPLILDTLAYSKFRLYMAEDLAGVQLGGALKNVLAIACGIVEAKKLGENAKSSLITRGLAEIVRLGQKMGAYPETFMGLSGVGDLMLTCMGSQSRNFKLGVAMGLGYADEDTILHLKETVEGVHTAKSIGKLAERLQIEMPICKMMENIIYHHVPIEKAIEDLLARPFKEESFHF
jgi:glycerol-3-phosphate dehydrogenase (NAD(P)+)